MDRLKREEIQERPQPVAPPPKRPRPVLLVDLKPDDCRWIVNDDTRRAEFCALPRDGSSVYCAHHHRMAYVKSAAPRNTFRQLR